MMMLAAFKLLILLLYFTNCYTPVKADCRISDDCLCGNPAFCCFRVSENEAGAFVGQITDTPSLQPILNGTGDITYSILSNGDKINITDDGLLRTAKALDRELEDCFTVLVEVKDNQMVSINIGASVEVTDVNDNPPQFGSAIFKVSVLENDVAINMDVECSNDLVAVDKDSGQNGTVEYKVISSTHNNFTVVKEDAEVCLRNEAPLDREETDNITIVLQAEDNGVPNTLSSNITIILQLEDSNDNAPMFIEPNLFPNISETAPNNSLVVQYTAVDKDIGANGDVTFSIIPTTPEDFPFRLNSLTGEIYLNGSLDFDDGTKFYEFKIIAKDNGGIPQETPLTGQINVLNFNNKEPIIENEDDIDLVFSRKEGLVDDAVLAFIRVSDSDSESFSATIENGSEYCTIEEVSNPNLHLFRLKLSVNELDYEQVQEIPLVVVISDNGEPALTATLIRTIQIIDINDNPPYLTQTSFNVIEEQNIGTHIIMLREVFADLDDGSNGEFGKFHQLNGSNLVTINANGDVTTNNQFDREEIGSYIQVQVQIFDNGLNSTQLNSTETILIHLLDINDNSPVFISSSIIYVKENELSYVNFSRVLAEDPDEGSNGMICYEILNSSIFRIDSKTGFLSSMEEFDRETISSYEVTITATDFGDDPKSADITVTIQIMDVNDNPPEFITPLPTFSTSSNDPIGTIVGKIEVDDDDIGENAEVGFFLSDVTYFSINDSGVIQIVRQLPLVSETEFVNLIVTVYNIQDVTMNSSASLNITIQPESTESSRSVNFDNILIYFPLSLAITLLIIGITFVIVLICFVTYCRSRRKSKDLSSANATVDHGVPRRSSLRATPSAGRDLNDSINHLENLPRSPTVLFSSEYSVRYYDQEKATTKSEFETRTVKVDNTGDIESPQIPTKDSLKGKEEEEEEEEEEEKVSSPQLSDLSTSSSISNGYPPYFHQIDTNPMTLREDVLKKHNKSYSESFVDNRHDGVYRDGLVNIIPHERVYTDGYMSTNRHYPPTGHVMVSEPLDKEDDDDTSNYNDDNLPPIFQQYLSSRPRSNQSISAPVSHYVSQNGNSVDMDPTPTLRYIHPPPNSHLQHKSVPAVYYQHNHINMPVSSRGLYPVDSIPYDQPSLHMNGTVRKYSSSSSSSPHRMHSELPPQPYVHQSTHIHHPSRHSHDLPTVQINGRRSPPDYCPHIPPSSHMHPCEHHRSYQHPILQDKLVPHISSVNYPYHSFASEDNSTVASSVLDNYLQFNHNSQKQDYLFSEDSISMDEMKFSSTDMEKEH